MWYLLLFVLRSIKQSEPMKQTVRIQTLLVFTFVCLLHTVSFSQVSVVSANGYAVNIDVRAISITPASNNCTWGYNYTVKLRYNISITGNNRPSSLYMLQGTVGCGATSSFFDLPNNGGAGTVNSANNWTSQTNCATVTTASLECNLINIQISGPGISSQTVSFSPSESPLAVKLVSFTAEQQSKRVKLNWTTASETDNSYFTIERSTDGAEWKEIKKVNGAGNSTNIINYESYDEAPVAGNVYYRLKQTDLDGQSSYSDIQLVKYVAAVNGITLYPVPNAGNTVNISGITDFKNHEMAVLNAAGSVVYTATLSKASVNLPALQPGMYIIRLKGKVSGETYNLRYIKI
jgi:hypothetical protein